MEPESRFNFEQLVLPTTGAIRREKIDSLRNEEGRATRDPRPASPSIAALTPQQLRTIASAMADL
jgi:hypothetical protein